MTAEDGGEESGIDGKDEKRNLGWEEGQEERGSGCSNSRCLDGASRGIKQVNAQGSIAWRIAVGREDPKEDNVLGEVGRGRGRRKGMSSLIHQLASPKSHRSLS